MSRKFVVHAASIPEWFRDFTPEKRHAMGLTYVNACNGKPWVHAPDGSLEEPWTVEPCEVCKIVVSCQPRRSGSSAPLRPGHPG